MPKTSKKTTKKKVAKSKKSTSIKTKPIKVVKKVIVEEKKTKAPVKISKNYLPKETEKYMCEKHLVFFEALQLRSSLMGVVDSKKER